MFPEVASLLNPLIERKVILNAITQENNKVVGDEINKTVKLHMMDRSTEEAVSTFQSVIEAEQLNIGPHKKIPLDRK